LFFLIFFKTSNINFDSEKNQGFQKQRVKSLTCSKTSKNLNSFLDDIENAKNDANIYIKKTYCFGFSLFFAIFGFFSKILSNRWVKN